MPVPLLLTSADFIGSSVAGTEVGLFGAKTLDRKLLQTALWLGVGVALYLTLTNTIGSLLNPLLASVKLSATPT